MADDLLHVGDKAFDTDDLTYAERIRMKGILRNEVWNEEEFGPLDEALFGPDEIIPATIVVFMQRTNPDYTLEDALSLKPSQVTPDDEVPTPPTAAAPAKPASPKRASRAKTPAASGSRN